MRVLRLGMNGEDVEAWQRFLAEEGFNPGVVDGDFGPRTATATKEFQKRFLLIADGIVGRQTVVKAMEMGFDPLEWSPTPPPTNDPYFPAPPAGLNYLSERKAFELYGQFDWTPAGTSAEPRAIKIKGDWTARNLITIDLPQLARIGRPARNTRITVHRLAAPKLQALWADWERDGLLSLVKTWDGMFNPRRIGGSNTVSNHAFGVAFDINAGSNPWGGNIPLVGQAGSVRLLVPAANKNGFYWGGHYKGKKDGMHFELSRP